MYSSAQNNLNVLGGQPDPQTGLFSFAYPLATLTAEAGFGPSFALRLCFNALSSLYSSQSGVTNLFGLGPGWSFPIANYNKASGQLTLSSGESFVVFWAANQGEWELSHKLLDLKVVREGDVLTLYCKDGSKEILTFDENTGNAYLQAIESPSGRALFFDYYQNITYGTAQLSEVRDVNHTLLKIEYQADSGAKICLFPQSPEEKTYQILYSLTNTPYRLILPDQQSTIELQFSVHSFPDSQSSRIYLIDSIHYPTGAVESAQYDHKLYMQQGAPIPYQPAISQYTKIVASNQPATLIAFSYGEKDDPFFDLNYWGNNSSASWSDNMDNLWDYPSDYEYTSQMQYPDAENQVTQCQRFRYNKFHQLIEQITTHGSVDDQIVKTLEYYSLGDKIFAEQPATYELPKSSSTILKQSDGHQSQTFTQTTCFDDWGNLLEQKDVSGLVTKLDFYPPEGELELCPAHPFAMVAFAKKQETIGVGLSPSDPANKIYYYTYQANTTVVSNGYFVAPDSVTYDKYKVCYNYFDNTSEPSLLSELKSQELHLGEQTTKRSFSYKFLDNEVTKTTAFIGYDGVATSNSETYSTLSQQVLVQTNIDGISTAYYYDVLDRLIEKIEAKSTDYQQTTSYKHQLLPKVNDIPSGQSNIGLRIQSTTQQISQRVYQDANGNELSTYQQGNNGEFYQVSQQNYDNESRLLDETTFDYAFDANNQLQETYSSSTTYRYGVWGQVSQEEYSDGTYLTRQIDPLLLEIKEQLLNQSGQALPASITQFNLFQKPVCQQQLTSKGAIYSETRYLYDAFGRTSQVINPDGAIAAVQSYDGFDRPTQASNFDGSLYQASYAPFSKDRLLTRLDSVMGNKVNLGTRYYDGLNRPIEQSINDVQLSYQYQAENSQQIPHIITNSRGQIAKLSCIKALNQPSTICVKESESMTLTSQFDYATKDSAYPLGSLLSAKNTQGVYRYQYQSTGALQQKTQSITDQQELIWSVEQSTLSNEPLIKTNSEGRSITTQLDALGRVISTTDSLADQVLQTHTTFDDFNRITNIQTSVNEVPVQTTTLSYDDYNRELSREIKLGGDTYYLTYDYDTQNRIQLKRTLLNNTQILEENYRYDVCSRLTDYRITQYNTLENLPKNEHKRPIIGQSYHYDTLNNLTGLTTYFPGENQEYDLATCTYDIQRLIKIEHSLTHGDNAYPALVQLTYDADGNLTILDKDGSEVILQYSASNKIINHQGQSYDYDAFDRVLKRGHHGCYYWRGRIVSEQSHQEKSEYIRHNGIPIAIKNNETLQILATDNGNSTLAVLENEQTQTASYTPFGLNSNSCKLGYNGEIFDEASQGYLLGNGNRLYLPELASFASMDPFSPFSKGGLNPYLYCSGDPINLADPTGYYDTSKAGKVGAIFGILGGVVAMVAAPFTAGTSLGLILAEIGAASTVISAGASYGSFNQAQKGNQKASDIYFDVASAFMMLSLLAGLAEASTAPINTLMARKRYGSTYKEATFWAASLEDDLLEYSEQNNLSFGYSTKYTMAFESKSNPASFNLCKNSGTVFKINGRRGTSRIFSHEAVNKSIHQEYTVIPDKLYARKTRNSIPITNLAKDDGVPRSIPNTLSKNEAWSQLGRSLTTTAGEMGISFGYWIALSDQEE